MRRTEAWSHTASEYLNKRARFAPASTVVQFVPACARPAKAGYIHLMSAFARGAFLIGPDKSYDFVSQINLFNAEPRLQPCMALDMACRCCLLIRPPLSTVPGCPWKSHAKDCFQLMEGSINSLVRITVEPSIERFVLWHEGNSLATCACDARRSGTLPAIPPPRSFKCARTVQACAGRRLQGAESLGRITGNSREAPRVCRSSVRSGFL